MTGGRFDEPWQARLFALTVALNEAGHLDWPEWTEAFGRALARRGTAREPDGGADYHAAWLEALEALLAERGIAGRDLLGSVRAAWRQAYLATPHGAPVRLAEDAAAAPPTRE